MDKKVIDMLDEYREDNPEYTKYSNTALLKVLHKKHYSDTDWEDFMAEYEPEPPESDTRDKQKLLLLSDIKDALSKPMIMPDNSEMCGLLKEVVKKLDILIKLSKKEPELQGCYK